MRYLALVLSLFSVLAQAEPHAPLNGVEAVALQVREPSPQTRALGITREVIERRVTLALRRLGIGVVDSSPETVFSMGKHALPPPVVIVKVNAIRKRDGYVGGVKLWVAEQAELYRVPGRFRLLNTYHYSAGWSDRSAEGMRRGLYMQLRRSYRHLAKSMPASNYSPKAPTGPTFISMRRK